MSIRPKPTFAHSKSEHARRFSEDGSFAWRAPHPPQTPPESVLRIAEPFHTCSYCGSIHPAEFAAAIRAGATVEVADMKYGWPHKVYVRDAPNPYAGLMEIREATYHGDGREPVPGPERPAGPAYGTFRTIHLDEATPEDRSVMETLLEKIAERALVEDRWRRLLDAVRAKELKLPDLLAADTRGRLEVLLRSLSDPLLHETIEQFEQATDVERITQVGLEHLTSYMSPASRLSDLADGKTVTALCRRAEREGRKRNSVRRTLLRSISMLLRYHLGAGERDRIFAEVHFAGRDDTREVLLRPEEIERLLASCDELGYAEMRVITRMALQTGADRCRPGRPGRRAAGRRH